MSKAKASHNPIRPYFDHHNARLETALSKALAQPIELEPGRRLQFEICLFFYGIVLCVTEEEIVPDSLLMDSLPAEVLELIEDAGGDSLVKSSSKR